MISEIPSSTLGVIGAAIALPIVYVIFRSIGFFTRNQKVHEHYDLEDLTAIYKKWELFGTFLFVLFILLGTLALSIILIAGADVIHQSVRDEDTLFIPANGLFFALPALFASIVFAILPAHLLLKLLLRGRFHDLECYLDMKNGMNSTRVCAFLGVITLLFVAALILFISKCYWVFEKDEFALNPLTELTESRYKYSDIQELRYILKFKALTGHVRDEPYYEIVTKDGERWTSKYGPSQDKDLMKKLFDTLQSKTNLEIKQYDITPES